MIVAMANGLTWSSAWFVYIFFVGPTLAQTVTLTSSVERQAACPGEEVTFTCMVTESVRLRWIAEPFIQESDPIQFAAAGAITGDTGMDPSGQFMAILDTIMFSGGVADFTSRLIVTASVSGSLNGTVVQCSGQPPTMMNTPLIIAAPPSPPQQPVYSVSQYSLNSFTVAVQWESPASDGVVGIDSYTLTGAGITVPLTVSSSQTLMATLTLSYNDMHMVSITACNCAGKSAATVVTIVEVGCGPPPPPPNGSLGDLTSSQEGAVVTFQCNPELVPSQQMMSDCATNGSWTPDPAELVCRADCGDPSPPANGFVTASNSNSTLEGSQIDFQCNPGLVPSQQMMSVCAADGSWTPDPAEQTCDCGVPVSPTNGTVNYTTTTVGSLATFQCSAGLVPVALMTAVCEESGWSPDPGDLSCVDVPVPCNGALGNLSCDDVADGMCYTASYAVQPDDSVTFTVSARTPANTWVGLGVSEDQMMVNTDIVLGAADGTNSFIHDRFAFERAEPPVDPSQDIESASAEHVDGVTTITFNRPRNSGDINDTSLDECRFFLFAYGGRASFFSMPPVAMTHGMGPTRRAASLERICIPFTECSAGDCGVPASPTNGTVAYTTTTEGSLATFQCSAGLVPGEVMTAVCEESGGGARWSPDPGDLTCVGQATPADSSDQAVVIAVVVVVVIAVSVAMVATVIIVYLCWRKRSSGAFVVKTEAAADVSYDYARVTGRGVEMDSLAKDANGFYDQPDTQKPAAGRLENATDGFYSYADTRRLPPPQDKAGEASAEEYSQLQRQKAPKGVIALSDPTYSHLQAGSGAKTERSHYADLGLSPSQVPPPVPSDAVQYSQITPQPVTAKKPPRKPIDIVHPADKLLNLDTVLAQLVEVQESWYELGTGLGVPVPTLDDIRSQCSSSQECMIETIDSWIWGHAETPTWKTITAVLRQINFQSLAASIDQVYTTGELPIPFDNSVPSSSLGIPSNFGSPGGLGTPEGPPPPIPARMNTLEAAPPPKPPRDRGEHEEPPPLPARLEPEGVAPPRPPKSPLSGPPRPARRSRRRTPERNIEIPSRPPKPAPYRGDQ